MVKRNKSRIFASEIWRSNHLDLEFHRFWCIWTNLKWFVMFLIDVGMQRKSLLWSLRAFKSLRCWIWIGIWSMWLNETSRNRKETPKDPLSSFESMKLRSWSKLSETERISNDLKEDPSHWGKVLIKLWSSFRDFRFGNCLSSSGKRLNLLEEILRNWREALLTRFKAILQLFKRFLLKALGGFIMGLGLFDCTWDIGIRNGLYMVIIVFFLQCEEIWRFELFCTGFAEGFDLAIIR